MIPADVARLRRYEHLRDVELNLCNALNDLVPDAGLDFAARAVGVPERGEALYETEDFAVYLEFARHHHQVRGKTVIERLLARRKPAVGSETHLVLSAMMSSQITLLRLGEQTRGVGVEVEDLLFGHRRFLADVQLSRWTSQDEMCIVTRLLVFEDFCMTPCTSWLDFDPELARMLSAGLARESHVPMVERFASVKQRAGLAAELVAMALCSVASVREGLVARFGLPTLS